MSRFVDVFADACSLAERGPIVNEDPHGGERPMLSRNPAPSDTRNSLSVNRLTATGPRCYLMSFRLEEISRS